MKRTIKLFILVVAIILCFSGAVVLASEYHLDTGDVLEISVWGMEEQNANSANTNSANANADGIIIRPDGKIAFPLVGEVQAAGLSRQN